MDAEYEHAGLLRDVGELAFSGSSPAAVTERAVDALPAALGADAAASWRLDARSGEVLLQRGAGWPAGMPATGLTHPEAPLLLPDVPLVFCADGHRDGAGHEDAGFGPADRGPLAGVGIRSGMVVPLAGHGRKGMAIGVYSRSERRFTDAELAVLETVAELVGAAQARVRSARLATELSETRRFATLGSLVASAAHDFNNMLAAVLANVREVAAAEPGSEQVESGLAEIDAAGRRATALARSLVDLSRPLSAQVEVLAVGTVVADVCRLVDRLLGEDIELTYEPGAPGAAVSMVPGELDRVLVNVLINAGDAGSRAIRVRTTVCAAVLGAPPAPASADPVLSTVVIEVRDDGSGMRPDVLARALQPSFTTKPVGQGSGVGLASAAAIVEAAGGTIELDSEPGAGTTVTIRLPSVVAG